MKTSSWIVNATLRASIISALILPALIVTVAAQIPAGDYPEKKVVQEKVEGPGQMSFTAPGNDNFASAASLSTGGLLSGTNLGSTGQTGEPNHAGVAGELNSVWYKFSAPLGGVFTIGTESATPASLEDTVIAVYSGSSLDSLTPLAGSDDYIATQHARVTFGIQPGQVYYIAIDGFGSLEGNFNVSYMFLGSPANDAFANAQDLGMFAGGPYHGVSGTNFFATAEVGEPVHEPAGPGASTNSIWYRWMSTQPRSVTFRTDGSNYDTVLAIYTGSSVDNLTLVAKNDDFGPLGTTTSRVTFFAPPGIYYIAIEGFQTSSGNNVLRWEPYRNESGKRWDFDNDLKADISIFRPSNGQWWIKNSGNGAVSAATFGAGTDKMTPADFTGDGRVDIGVWRPSNGTWYVLRSEDNTYYGAPFGMSGDIPAVGQFDRDARADLVVFRPSTGTFYVHRSYTGQVDFVPFGQAGDVPVVADYDGDGRSDVAIFRPSNGQWWLNRSKAGVLGMTFGVGTDKPVVGDYTGDGRADVAFWRPSTGEWVVLRSEDSSYYSAPFGLAPDIPVAGDYDGDRKFDFAVFRPSNGFWYVNKTGGGVTIEPFGMMGDRPTPNSFVP